MTLRRRLTDTYIFVALVGLLLASLAGVLLVRSAQVRAAERTARLITGVVTAQAREDGLRFDNPMLQNLVTAAGGRLLLVERDGTVLRDSAGTLEGERLRVRADVLAQTGTPERAPIRRVQIEGQPQFMSVLRPAGQAPANSRLLIAIPSATLLDSWLLMLPAVLLLSAFGVAIAGMIGWRISEKITKPIEELITGTKTLAAGDYETRVESQSEVAELQTLAKSFNAMATEVRHARQTQRDFLANVSHDLRTPLTSIQGFSQAMMDGAVPSEQTARVAGIIHNEADRLSRLVQDLLDLARIEAGRFSMVQRDINLQTVLQRCSDKFKLQAESLGIAFETDIPRRALPVHGDADRLEQVVTNLIDNALVYAQDGGGHVMLVGGLGGIRGSGETSKPTNGHSSDEAHHEDDPTKKLGRWWIEIKVQDDGPGIADEQKPLVFERFHRADHARVGSGLGLGLAIAREIVEAHGGDITIEDGDVRGTQFIVRLPMKMR